MGKGSGRKKEREEEGKTRLVGDCQSKKNIFMRLERVAREARELGEAFSFPSLAEQLHSARLECVTCLRLPGCASLSASVESG